MAGYSSTRDSTQLASLFEAYDATDGALVADYNIAPTDPAPIVRNGAEPGGRELSLARWGLVPVWASDLSGAARMINARSETVATSRVFAQAYAQRRCLVPADGWYEWRRVEAAKQPYFMTRRDGAPMVFAGLWSAWGKGERRLTTFTVLTRSALGELAVVHDRMPVLLPSAYWDQWLTTPDPSGLVEAAQADYLAGIELRPVSRLVGDVRNDGPELVREVSPPVPRQSTVDLTDPTLF